MYASAGLWSGRAVPQRSLPPCGPHVGEGQGGGYNKHCVSSIGRLTNAAAVVLESAHSFPLSALSTPPSLSLPHKGPQGGGNREARAFANRYLSVWREAV